MQLQQCPEIQHCLLGCINELIQCTNDMLVLVKPLIFLHQHLRVQLCGEEFAFGIDPKSLHAIVLMQTVYNAVVRHSRGFLKHVAISVTEKVKIMAA